MKKELIEKVANFAQDIINTNDKNSKKGSKNKPLDSFVNFIIDNAVGALDRFTQKSNGSLQPQSSQLNTDFDKKMCGKSSGGKRGGKGGRR